jgi:Ca2+-binding EF-hand superfamily protein
MASIKRTEAKEAERKFKSDLDKVEAAFRKLDKDGDGYIDWEEFKEVSKDLGSEQAKDIFEACDKVILSHFTHLLSLSSVSSFSTVSFLFFQLSLIFYIIKSLSMHDLQ